MTIQPTLCPFCKQYQFGALVCTLCGGRLPLTDDPVERFIRDMKTHTDEYCAHVPFGERPDYVQELIASVQSAYEKLYPCRDFRPDHNGECLNCDEWADAHDLPEEGK
jgi:hypothetical protein